jgi:hypothetical protein
MFDLSVVIQPQIGLFVAAPSCSLVTVSLRELLGSIIAGTDGCGRQKEYLGSRRCAASRIVRNLFYMYLFL